MTIDKIKEIFDFITEQLKGQNVSLSSGQKGAVIGTLNKYLGSDITRRIFLERLFGVKSSKQLDDVQWYLLYQWIGFEQDEDGLWQVCKCFVEMCNMFLKELDIDREEKEGEEEERERYKQMPLLL